MTFNEWKTVKIVKNQRWKTSSQLRRSMGMNVVHGFSVLLRLKGNIVEHVIAVQIML